MKSSNELREKIELTKNLLLEVQAVEKEGGSEWWVCDRMVKHILRDAAPKIELDVRGAIYDFCVFHRDHAGLKGIHQTPQKEMARLIEISESENSATLLLADMGATVEAFELFNKWARIPVPEEVRYLFKSVKAAVKKLQWADRTASIYAQKDAEFEARIQARGLRVDWSDNPVPEYADNELGRRVKQMREAFTEDAGLDQIYAIGELLYNELVANDKGFTPSDDLVKMSEDLRRHQKEIDEDPDSHRRRLGFAKFAAEVKALDDSELKQRADESVALLAKFRRMNAGGCWANLSTRYDCRNGTKRIAQRALELMPGSFARCLVNRPPTVVGKAKRGYFKSGGKDEGDTIKISNEPPSRCMLHEFGHQLERNNATIAKAVHDFYVRRTTGYPIEKLNKVTNISYGDKELCIVDHFIKPYMGKIYQGDVTSHEVLSMGIEYFFFERETLKKDPDYFKFILGILATF